MEERSWDVGWGVSWMAGWIGEEVCVCEKWNETDYVLEEGRTLGWCILMPTPAHNTEYSFADAASRQPVKKGVFVFTSQKLQMLTAGAQTGAVRQREDSWPSGVADVCTICDLSGLFIIMK